MNNCSRDTQIIYRNEGLTERNAKIGFPNFVQSIFKVHFIKLLAILIKIGPTD